MPNMWIQQTALYLNLSFRLGMIETERCVNTPLLLDHIVVLGLWYAATVIVFMDSWWDLFDKQSPSHCYACELKGNVRVPHRNKW